MKTGGSFLLLGLQLLQPLLERLDDAERSPRIVVLQGKLLAKGTLRHSYPHSWRSKAPVIFRATPQWFVAIDKPFMGGKSLRALALEAIKAAIPNLEMDKNAGAELTAQLMALQQRAVDRAENLHGPVHSASSMALRMALITRRCVESGEPGMRAPAAARWSWARWAWRVMPRPT